MLAEFPASLASVALFVFAGACLQAVLPRPLESSVLARLGFAFALGVVWTGLVAWALGFVFGAVIGRGLFLACILLAGLAALAAIAVRGGDLGGLKVEREVRLGRRSHGPLFAGALITVASIALLADAAVKPVHDFDGIMTWGTQARYLQAARSVLPPVLVDPETFVVHPRYPILMPLVQVATSELAGRDQEISAVRPCYVLFLPALVAVMVPALRRFGGGKSAALVLVLLFSAPALLWDIDVGPRGTYSDFPFAVFLGSGWLILIDPRTRRDPWRGMAAGLLLAGAVGTKTEGLLIVPLVIVLGFALGLGRGGKAGRSRRPSASPWIAAGIALAASVLVLSWRLQIPNRYDEGYLEGFSSGAVVAGLVGRAPEIFCAVAWESLDPRQWGGVFWVSPILVAVGWRGLRRGATAASIVLLGGHGAVACSAYALAPDLGIIGVTWSRFVVQMIVPLAVVLTATAREVVIAAGLGKRRRSAFSPATVG